MSSISIDFHVYFVGMCRFHLQDRRVSQESPKFVSTSTQTYNDQPLRITARVTVEGEI
jgi:hypothetical protein